MMTEEEFRATIPDIPKPCIECGQTFTGMPSGDLNAWPAGYKTETIDDGTRRIVGNLCAKCMKVST